LDLNLAPLLITVEENLDLIKLVTENEIYAAVFQMDPHKAPGLDGFGASFPRSLDHY